MKKKWEMKQKLVFVYVAPRNMTSSSLLTHLPFSVLQTSLCKNKK